MTAILTPFENQKVVAQGFNDKLKNDKPDLPITGGTYLTTTDLPKWSVALTSNKMISKNSVFELGKHFNQPKVQSALGGSEFENNNIIQQAHHGRAGSFEAILCAYVNQKITIILLDNNYNGKIHELTNALNKIIKN